MKETFVFKQNVQNKFDISFCWFIFLLHPWHALFQFLARTLELRLQQQQHSNTDNQALAPSGSQTDGSDDNQLGDISQRHLKGAFSGILCAKFLCFLLRFLSDIWPLVQDRQADRQTDAETAAIRVIGIWAQNKDRTIKIQISEIGSTRHFLFDVSQHFALSIAITIAMVQMMIDEWKNAPTSNSKIEMHFGTRWVFV